MTLFSEFVSGHPMMVSLLCATLGSFFTAFGLILMKIATIKAEGTESEKNPMMRKDYLFGLIIVILAQAFNAMALKFGNLILIATTSCFCIVITAILTPIMLKEKFMWRVDGLSIGLITIGCTIAIY
jgi:uncharacterized membrane protein